MWCVLIYAYLYSSLGEGVFTTCVDIHRNSVLFTLSQGSSAATHPSLPLLSFHLSYLPFLFSCSFSGYFPEIPNMLTLCVTQKRVSFIFGKSDSPSNQYPQCIAYICPMGSQFTPYTHTHPNISCSFSFMRTLRLHMHTDVTFLTYDKT